MQKHARFQLVLFALACVPLLFALWNVPFLPTHDGPKQVYAAHVRAHVNDPAFVGEFEPAVPLTSFGFGLVYAVLEALFSWRIAYGLAWTLVVATLPVGVFVLARAFSPLRTPVALFAVAGALHWSVHMGFANFVPSVGLGLLAVGIGLGADTWSARRELAVYFVLLVTCAFHPVGAQFASVSLFVFRVLGTARGRIVREVGAVLIGCAPAVVITVASSDALSDFRARGMLRQDVFPLTPLERIENLSICFLSGPLWRSLPVLLAGAAGIAFGIYAIGRWLLRERKQGTPFDRRTASVLALVSLTLVLALTTPMHGAGWEFMQPRFIPPTVFGGLVLVPFERFRMLFQRLVVGAGMLAAVSSNLWFAQQNAAFVAMHHDALTGFGLHPQKGRTLLPVVAKPDTGLLFQRDRTRATPYSAPLFNLGQLYAVDRDAITPYAFALLPSIHMLTQENSRMGKVPKRDYAEFFRDGADPAVRESELVRLGTFGLKFDDLMFYGAPDEVDRLISLGYSPETRTGGFMIGSFVGCPVDVEVTGVTSSGVLSLGWVPADRQAYTFDVETPGDHRFHIDRGSCEAMWVRWLPGDKSAGPVCRGANELAVLSMSARVDTVRCELEPRAPAGEPKP